MGGVRVATTKQNQEDFSMGSQGIALLYKCASWHQTHIPKCSLGGVSSRTHKGCLQGTAWFMLFVLAKSFAPSKIYVVGEEFCNLFLPVWERSSWQPGSKWFQQELMV